MSGRSAARLLAAVLSALACSGGASQLDHANTLRRASKPREALREYRDLLAGLGDGPLSKPDSELRLQALQSAADVSYLELGEYGSAIAYYRRIIELRRGSPQAYEARALIGDIYRDRLNDHHAAIAQYAQIAASESEEAPVFQLKVAREYLMLKDYQQARTEAHILRERWPQNPLADDAQLLTAQAWALEKRTDEALGAYQAAVARKPRPEIAAQALEAQAELYAQRGGAKNLERAFELYTRAVEGHPNPDAVRMELASVKRRRDLARTVKPGDREAVFDRRLQGGAPGIPGEP